MKTIKVLCLIFFFSLPNVSKAAENEDSKPKVTSEVAFLLDNDTGAILFQQNGFEKMYPASLTKIATAIYAIEKGDLDDMVTVSENAYETEGTSVYLEIGEKVTLKHLLQGMLINSGNDAAVAIAEHLDGTVTQFEKNINTYLNEEVHVHSTHFTNPNGLFDRNHYTTAHDLALITQYALKNDTFRVIYGTKELFWDGETWDTTLISHHQMLNGERPYHEVIGGKTGYVDESKQTLATTAENKNMSLTAIVLKGNFKRDVYKDTKELLDYGFQNFKHEYISSNQNFTTEQTTYKLDTSKEVTVSNKNSHQELTSSGVLLIESSEGDILHSIPLNKVQEDKEETKDPLTVEVKTEGKKSGISLSVVLFGMLVIGCYYLNKWAKDRKRV